MTANIENRGGSAVKVLLIAENKPEVGRLKSVIAERLGDCDFYTCSPGLEMLHIDPSFIPDLALIQLNHRILEAPGLVKHLKSQREPVYIMLLMGIPDFDILEQSLKEGADDFIIGEPADRELAFRLGRFECDGSGAWKRRLAGDVVDCKSGNRRQAPNFLGRAARVTGNVAFGMLLVIMAVMAFFLIQGRISGGAPTVLGYHIYVVLSGSMSPTFDTGSIVFVRPSEPENIEVDDIITFSNSGSLTTHRVVDRNNDNGLAFITRGDANNVDDPAPVPAEKIVGRVHGSVPLVGYLMGFAQTRQGLVFLVFIPGVLIISYELRNIYRAMGDADSTKKKTRRGRRH